MEGVLDRHPTLRGAAVELGAGWVPEMLRRLDAVANVYSRFDTSVQFSRRPSEQITQQMGFTPMHHEDVGNMIAQSNAELYMFSSDYPHLEGTRDPIGRFERTLPEDDEGVRDLFYAENFLRLFPEARVS